MKKIIIIAAALLAGFAANAQNIWLSGAFTQETSSSKVGDIKADTGKENGFWAGIEYDFNITDWFTIAPAVTVNGLFSKEDITTSNYFGVDIPVYFRGTYHINSDFGIFAQVAPALNIGLFDNVKVGNADPVDIIGDSYKRCGAYAVAGVGVQIKDVFRIFANYDIALTNYSPVESIKYGSRGFSVGIAFGF